MPLVYAVHHTRIDAVGAMSVIYDDLGLAEEEAQARSKGYGVICASVTSFEMNKPGTRKSVSWFEKGARMPRNFPEPHEHMRPMHAFR